MKKERGIFKYKNNDNFYMIDRFTSKLLIISLSAILVFNVSSYMFKSDFSQYSVLNANAKNINNKFKVGFFSNKNISLQPFENKMPLQNTDEIYYETIYFTENKDLGKLVNKAIDLIELSSTSTKERYIEVVVKNYDTEEDFFIINWDRNNELNYNVYIK